MLPFGLPLKASRHVIKSLASKLKPLSISGFLSLLGGRSLWRLFILPHPFPLCQHFFSSFFRFFSNFFSSTTFCVFLFLHYTTNRNITLYPKRANDISEIISCNLNLTTYFSPSLFIYEISSSDNIPRHSSSARSVQRDG